MITTAVCEDQVSGRDYKRNGGPEMMDVDAVHGLFGRERQQRNGHGNR
jgi:hypothetical protein